MFAVWRTGCHKELQMNQNLTSNEWPWEREIYCLRSSLIKPPPYFFYTCVLFIMVIKNDIVVLLLNYIHIYHPHSSHLVVLHV